ncbi:MAG TPA: hypothetical protein VFL19_06185 [Nitrospira sp.]|nr:hypothetical protein [Nitrospira sp.]
MAQKFGNGRWVREGFLDNRIPGTVVGRIVLAAIGPVDLYLQGDFKPDIAGQLIQFHNSRFEEDELAAQVIGDLEIPQIGIVNLISFDPHPNLVPHPYVEWFSAGSNHYRFELEASDAWIVPSNECGIMDEQSREIRARLAGLAVEPPKREDSEWL